MEIKSEYNSSIEENESDYKKSPTRVKYTIPKLELDI
jgi:hypothetical protein